MANEAKVKMERLVNLREAEAFSDEAADADAEAEEESLVVFGKNGLPSSISFDIFFVDAFLNYFYEAEMRRDYYYY